MINPDKGKQGHEKKEKSCDVSASAQTTYRCRNFWRMREDSRTDDIRERQPGTAIGFLRARSAYKRELARKMKKKVIIFASHIS
jgi:hypothetical protein